MEIAIEQQFVFDSSHLLALFWWILNERVQCEFISHTRKYRCNRFLWKNLLRKLLLQWKLFSICFVLQQTYNDLRKKFNNGRWRQIQENFHKFYKPQIKHQRVFIRRKYQTFAQILLWNFPGKKEKSTPPLMKKAHNYTRLWLVKLEKCENDYTHQ